MPVTTARLALPTPTLSEAADVPASMLALAQALDTLALWSQGTLAARPAAVGTAGRLYYASDTGHFYVNTGTAWIDVGPTVVTTDSITANEIAANSIGTSELADNAVDTAAIQAGAVTNSKIAALAVDATQLASSLKPSGGAGAATEALRTLGLGAGQAMPGNQVLGQSQLGTDSVGAAQIQAGAVGASEIADGSVGTAELAAALAWLLQPESALVGPQLFPFGSPTSFGITVPATGTYIVEWGFLHYDTENTNAVSALSVSAYGGAGISGLSNESGHGLLGPGALGGGSTVTVTAGHQSGASAGRFDSPWVKLTRTA